MTKTMKGRNGGSVALLPAREGATEELISALCLETERLITSGNLRFNRYGLWFDTRFALWEGQNDEGTKELADAFPWPGASDTRVRLADAVIKERKALRKAAFWGKRVQARALRGAVNAGGAVLVTTLMKWMLYVQGLSMVKRELELGWSYQDTYGAAVMGCFWRQKTRVQPVRLDLQEMLQFAQQSGDGQTLETVQSILDPLLEPGVVMGLQSMFPDNTASELKRAVKTMRDGGTAEIRTKYVCKNEPRWLALRPGIDVFFDGAADDLGDAPLVVCRELLTEADVREKESSEGWDAEFIDRACAQAGRSGLGTALDPLSLSPRGSARHAYLGEDTDRRIEILRAFYFVSEKQSAGLYQTVFHREVKDVAAYHELHSYEHGEMPFHAWRSETEERPILESRGVPEICLTWQIEKKGYRDSHLDRMSMEVLPTLLVPRGYAGEVLIGAGQQIERKRPGDYEFLKLPEVGGTTEHSQRMLEKEVNEYFGRFDREGDPVLIQVRRQELATDTLTDLAPVVSQTWQLAQQYLTDEEVAAVAGPLAPGVRLGRKDIAGQYQFELTFDARSLDADFYTNVLTVVEKAVSLDRAGRIDLGELVTALLEGVSPDLAQRVIRSQASAEMAEVSDELQQLAQIAVGIEPPLKPAQNPQLRLKVLEQVMQSPRFRQVVMQDATGVSGKLLENQEAKYRFAIEQYVDNAAIGRVGVRPVLGGDGSGLPSPAGGAMPAPPPTQGG